MNPPGVVVVGAGPGVSRSVALRFASAGYAIGLVGNDAVALTKLEQELAATAPVVESRCVDITNSGGARAALDDLVEQLADVHALHFNPSVFRERDLLSLTVEELLADVSLGTGAFITALQATVPRMRPGSRITATGSVAADRPWHRAATLGVQKAGIRVLIDCADQALKGQGIRATSLTVCGTLAAEGPFSPANVGNAVFAASQQPEERWCTEVRYEG